MSTNVESRQPDSEQQVSLINRIERLRELATRECTPDLASCVDAAAILTQSMNDAESADQEAIFTALCGLMDVVEESVRRRPSADSGAHSDFTVPPDKALILDMVLGEILVQLGSVTEDQVDAALVLQRSTGLRIGESLVADGVANVVQIQEGLRKTT